MKRWGKEARTGLPESSSGLTAASGVLGVHREPSDLPLGLPGCGLMIQSSLETSHSTAPRL